MHRTLTVVKIGGALLDSADTFHGTFASHPQSTSMIS